MTTPDNPGRGGGNPGPRRAFAPTARSIAAQVLVRVDKDGAFAAAALDTELTRAVQLAPRDRGLATELAYGTLRVRPWLDARIDRHAKRGIKGLEPRARAHLEIAAYQLFFLARVPSFAAVNDAVNLVRAVSGARVAAFANAVLRALSAEAAREEPKLQEAIVASTAPWLKDALGRALGAESVAPFLASSIEAPPLGIRIEDPAPAARDAWLTQLRAAAPDATFELGHASPVAILGRGAGKPQALPGWTEGEWSVQEEGSQLIAVALGARAGETVLDACAGRGNKTGALAAAVGERGAVDAADLHPAKLEALARDLVRTRQRERIRATHAVDWSVGSGDVPRDFDRVLVDAPCSGVGTLRRRPDLQTRRTESDLATLPPLQRAILARTAEHVRPGGRLVYAVCSVLREEAEDVVASLLAERADIALAPFDSAAARAVAGEETPTFRLLPHVHGTDGYFVASFVRKP